MTKLYGTSFVRLGTLKNSMESSTDAIDNNSINSNYSIKKTKHSLFYINPTEFFKEPYIEVIYIKSKLKDKKKFLPGA
ncbi:MAG TPA: hypothetical protein ENK52_01615 [Saprospiraceae bacterium]|nr:hypothetical protein [Saprospiraceae bacterium]